jgi:hypothetical protein
MAFKELSSWVSILNFPVADSIFIISLQESLVNCYWVKAKYIDAKDFIGIRAAVYKAAVNHNACYSPNRSKSIWYDDQSADLHISLLFDVKQNALSFRTYLEMWHLNNPLVVKPGVFSIEENVEVITVESDELSWVLWSDYVSGDSDSPLQSLEDFPASHASLDSALTAISASDPLAQFQSIESKESFTFLKPYKCHIKDKAKCSEVLKDNPSNFITASSTFHRYFDGMQTVDPITAQPCLPLVAIRPLEVTSEEYVGELPIKRQKLEIEMQFRSEDVANTISFKDGSGKISNVVWKSFIHVEDGKKCQDCLKWKYKKTMTAWKEADKTNEQMLNR